MKRLLWLTSVSLCVFAALPVAATEAVITAATATTLTYTDADFKGKAVQSAADMVKHIPNFILSGSGANGNVLIDGQRPNEGLSEALARLPVSSVARIERIPAGTKGFDMQGHAEIINVIRKPTSKPVVTLTTSANLYPDGRVKPQLGLTWQKNEQGRNLEAGLNLYQNNDDGADQGYKRVTKADGTITEQTIDSEGESRGAEARLAWSGAAAGGHVSADGKLKYNSSDYTSAYGTTEGELRKSNNLSAELSGQYQRDVSDDLKVRLNLWSRENQNDYERDYKRTDYSSTSEEDKTTREGNFSGTAIWARSSDLTLQAGAEQRYNIFDAESTYSDIWTAPDAVLNPTRVHGEENRASVYISTNWRPDERLTVDGAIAIESAEFRHNGAYNASQSYSYPKPRLSVVWKPDQTVQLRISRERQVGYMGYWDFVSVAQWQYEKPDQLLVPVELVPYRQWTSAISLDYRFLEKGQLAIQFEQNEIDDAVERVPVYTQDAIHEAPGNIGEGMNQRLSTQISVPTDHWRIDGGMMRLNATWNDSEVTDPITGEKRRISGQTPMTVSLNFNQDLPQMSWGFYVDKGWENTSWRAKAVGRSEGSPWVSLYAEYKPSPGLAIKAELQNLGSRTNVWESVEYENLRDFSAIRESEYSLRTSEPRLFLRVRNQL